MTSKAPEVLREEARERTRRWRLAHPGYQREWYARNRSHELARSKQYHAEHRAQILERGRAYRLTTGEYRRAYGRNRYRTVGRLLKTGWTSERFDEFLSAQEGCCAICGKPFSGTKDTHADHNRLTNTPRGILCGRCNVGIGMLGDDAERLRLAGEYLQTYAKGATT